MDTFSCESQMIVAKASHWWTVDTAQTFCYKSSAESSHSMANLFTCDITNQYRPL